MPKGSTNDFQKSVLREDAIKGNRLTRAQMEMILFPSKKYEREFQEHLVFQVKALPSSYLSSWFGAGVTSKSLSSSLGVFYGTYHRRVPYESNFVTRRKRSFENYNLAGFYLESRSDDASFTFSMAFEKTNTFVCTRVGMSVGGLLFPSRSNLGLPSLEAVVSYESLSGAGAGLALCPFDQAMFQVLYVVPDEADVFEQARLQTKLTPGLEISLRYYVD